jgi:hypothetical protein
MTRGFPSTSWLAGRPLRRAAMAQHTRHPRFLRIITA